MPRFQYLGQSHTFVQNVKGVAQKVKVVEGEFVDIEEGIHSDARLMMAGFRKVVEGAGEIIAAGADAIEKVVDSIQDIKDVVTGEDSKDTAPEATVTAPETLGDTADVTTPAETAENATVEAPSVEVTIEDDGKDTVSIQVENAKPAPKPAKNANAKK